MDNTYEKKIELTITACLEVAQKSDQPFQKAGEFFAALRNDGRWTSAEIVEVQTRVLNRLTSANQG